MEYAEDFATRCGVPVMDPDAGNFDEVIADLPRQDIPPDAVFHLPKETELTPMSEALSIPRRLIWLPPPKRARRATAAPLGTCSRPSRRIRNLRQTVLGLNSSRPASPSACTAAADGQARMTHAFGRMRSTDRRTSPCV